MILERKTYIQISIVKRFLYSLKKSLYLLMKLFSGKKENYQDRILKFRKQMKSSSHNDEERDELDQIYKTSSFLK